MNAYSRLYADTEARMSQLLGDLGQSFTESERNEVNRFLDAREYGLALETLSCILVEETKTIATTTLHGIDELAGVMQLRDERFMYDLHNFYDRQQGIVV